MRVVRAFLCAPLTAPLLYWAGSLTSALLDPARRNAALQSPLTSLAFVVAFGSPLAYAASLVAGVPAWWLLRRQTAAASAALILLGAALGLATAIVMGPYLRGELFSIVLTPQQGAGLGAASGGVFLWLARGNNRQPRDLEERATPPS